MFITIEREDCFWKLFLSQSSLDKSFVKKLAADIRRNDFFVLVDEAEIKVGDNYNKKK